MRFNSKTSVINKTENLAGGEAFKETPKTEFASMVLTSFVKDQFYRSENETLEKINELLEKVPSMFAAQTAIYARTKYGMRTISHVVAGELAKKVKGEEWTKRFYDKVVFRPDDMAEILSYYIFKYKKPIPNSLKKGLSTAFSKFDEYQLAKYRGEQNALSLIDIVNLVHPKPGDKNKVALEKMVKGELKSKDTWETDLTKAGQKAKDEEDKEKLKKEVWEKLIKEKKIGYFALLRNLRNIAEQAPDVLDEALALLVDANVIKKSLVLPFRFATAYEQFEDSELSGARKIMKALGTALDLSLANVPKFDGETLVVLDCSGSMEGRPAQIGSIFSAVLGKTNDADMILFSDDASYHNFNPADSAMTIAKGIHFASGGTNFHSIFETANKAYDRIIILSDMQGWEGYDAPTKTFAEYKKRVGANPKIYSFDLAGHGTLQFPEKNVFCLAGFSDKTLDILKLLEQDREALVHDIEQVVI